MKPLSYLAILLALWVGADAASPQQPRGPVIVAKTDLVTLAVTVVDRQNHFVAGLQQEHFTVLDGGERREIQLFTSEDLPATIGLVIDSSGSMKPRRADVIAAATAFADMSHPADQFFTLNFNERLWSGLPATTPFTEDRTQLYHALLAAPAAGMTALYDAVDRALEHLELGRHERKALIVVGDGGDNASTRTLDVVVEHARRSNAVIHAVTLFDQNDRTARPGVMKNLAEETGGRAYRPDNREETMRAFEAIAREIRSGYSIGFQPPDTVEGGFRPLKVLADAGDGRRLTVRTRAGYYAGPSAPATVR